MVNEGCSDRARMARKEVKKDRYRREQEREKERERERERERGGEEKEGGREVSLR